MTFRVTFLCKDKDMGEVLKRLNNIAYNVEHAFVPNVEEKATANGHISVRGADALQLFAKELHRRKITEITGTDFRLMVEKMGLNPQSYSYFLQNLVQGGVLRKGKKVTGSKGVQTLTYIVSEK